MCGKIKWGERDEKWGKGRNMERATNTSGHLRVHMKTYYSNNFLKCIYTIAAKSTE